MVYNYLDVAMATPVAPVYHLWLYNRKFKEMVLFETHAIANIMVKLLVDC